MTLRILIPLLLGAALPCAARAQLPPDASWRTLRTEHFRVTFQAGLEPLARHAAGRAEVAYAAIAAELTPPPRGTIDIVIADHVDLSNGFASPLPSNRIGIYAAPPTSHLSLQHNRDWIDFVITHELVHIFHLDETGPLGTALRGVFGRVPISWPIFPAIATPQWSIEGVATWYETRLTGGGRVHGTVHEMFVRTAALEEETLEIDEASGDTPAWPNERHYVYGSLFLDFVSDRYGPDVHRRLVRSTARAWLPPTFAFNRVARSATGRSFSSLWREWRGELAGRYARLADSLRAQGLTASERITEAGRYALHPRVSRDGRWLAYGADDGRNDPATRLIDLQTRESRAVARRNGGGGEMGPASWLASDAGFVASQLEFDGPYRIYHDLYRIRLDGQVERLSRGLRLKEPDVSPDGRTAVAVQVEGGTNRLVVFDLDSHAVRPLADYRADVQWSLPRWSPDGARIAVGRWRQGGEYDVVILDATGRVLHQPTTDDAVDAAPAWSADGRFVIFWSERSGIPNLYAFDTRAEDATSSARGEAARLRQVTSVLGGAFFPEVSTDGRWIYFSAYHADGFHIERIPFDTLAWRQPAPVAARFSQRTPGYDSGAPSDVAGVAAARRYSPLASLRPRFWLPVYLERAGVGTFFGAITAGIDVVERHIYDLTVAIAPDGGELLGTLGYSYAGLGNPLMDLFAERSWSSDPIGANTYIVTREDVVSVSARLARRRWRSFTSLSAGVERVRESSRLTRTDSLRLLDPRDDYVGAFVSASFGNARSWPLSISRENGVQLSATLRRRWDLDPGTAVVNGATRTFDRSYDQATGRLTAFRALRLPGFSNHAVAARVSGLARSGPGGTPYPVGGASGSGEEFLPGSTLGGGSVFLPVRGYEEGARRGTRAWSASLEYRLPLALVAEGIGLLPVFLDRLSGSAFLDIGDAYCSAEDARVFARCTDWVAEGDRLVDVPHDPLVGAGGELSFDVALFFAAPFRIRLGAGYPLTGPQRKAVGYMRFGVSF